ncbi:MAG: glycosyltransferase, partial [Promethearchaeota archaeon]
LIEDLVCHLPEMGHKVYTCNSNDTYQYLKEHRYIDTVIGVRASGCCKGAIAYKKKYKDIKIIAQWDDIHYFEDKVRNNRHNLFDNADVLLLTYHDSFLKRKEYSNFYHKSIKLPFHVGDNFNQIDTDWNSRKDKILLSGALSRSYPLRSSINRGCSSYVHSLSHPGYGVDKSHNTVREEYHAFLSSFKSAIATTGGGVLNYTVMKYYEIMAAGCLCLAEDTIDLRNLGFVPNEHYIPISMSNFKSKIKYINSNFNKYKEIADNGRRFVLENHTFKNRVDIIREALER